MNICSSRFSTIYASLNSESYHSLIGFHTPEYLGFLKLQVVPRFTGTCTYITHTRKPEPGYLNLSNRLAVPAVTCK
jgi:hypothetical protein